jgi:hypothetical protein
VPTVSQRDELWHRKHVMVDRNARQLASAVSAAEQRARHGWHARADDDIVAPPVPRLPSPSYYPLIAASGLPITAYGVLLSDALQVVLLATGTTILLFGLFGWAFEPRHVSTSRTQLGLERGRSGPTAR